MNRETLSEIKIGAVAGLFAAKMFMAEKAEVTFNLSVNGQLASVHMQVMELCEILGILLDNAVEAAAISSGKYVRADIEAIDDDGAVFRIENSVDRKPSISRMSEKGYTTKEEGSGIGLYIAETILQKYPASSLNTFADGERVVQEFCVK
jgi:two-component system sensor histidine kinase AgrC